MKRPKHLSKKFGTLLVACALRYPAVERVILFGSRARGDAGDRSDFDLAVITSKMTQTQWSQFAIEVEERLPTLCGVDLVKLSKTTPAPLRKQIQQQGIVLYDAA